MIEIIIHEKLNLILIIFSKNLIYYCTELNYKVFRFKLILYSIALEPLIKTILLY